MVAAKMTTIRTVMRMTMMMIKAVHRNPNNCDCHSRASSQEARNKISYFGKKNDEMNKVQSCSQEGLNIQNIDKVHTEKSS